MPYGAPMAVIRSVAAVLAGVLSAGGLPAAAASAGEGSPVIRPIVTWSIEDRFGMDADGDGFIDIPNTPEYAHNRAPGSCPGACADPRFEVEFLVGLTGTSVDPATLPVVDYRWYVSGGALTTPLQYVTTLPELAVSLPEGAYTIDVRAGIRFGWATLETGVVEDFVVEDLLVVAIGDSYASGEGNPESPRQASTAARWAGSYDPGATAAHAAAHRSSLAWPARVALSLERAGDATSVTFVTVAASGARIDAGILSPQGGEAPRAQLDELRAIVGNRRIDLLLIQAGGNDIGFTRVVRSLVEADRMFDPICYDRLIENTFAAVADGDWSRGVRLGYDAPLSIVCRPDESNRGWGHLPGLVGLPMAFDRLAEQLGGLDIDRVLLVGYPDPTGAEAGGSTCGEIVGDTTPPFRFNEIDRHEQALGVDRLLEPLNDTLRSVAASKNWAYVDGIAEAFAAGHGYCAPWPDYGYPDGYSTEAPPGRSILDHPEGWFRNLGQDGGVELVGGPDVTWYRTATQSAVLQGESRARTSGTLHPNELGHDAIARMVLSALGNG